MTNEIPKKSEGNPIELENTELETVAGGTVIPAPTNFKALCNTCHWESPSGTLTEAKNAEIEHRQNNPDHLVMVIKD